MLRDTCKAGRGQGERFRADEVLKISLAQPGCIYLIKHRKNLPRSHPHFTTVSYSLVRTGPRGQFGCWEHKAFLFAQGVYQYLNRNSEAQVHPISSLSGPGFSVYMCSDSSLPSYISTKLENARPGCAVLRQSEGTGQLRVSLCLSPQGLICLLLLHRRRLWWPY